MSIEVKVPVFPESVADGVLVRWHKNPGEQVKRGENLADIETDKVVFDLPAERDGVLQEILEQEGATVLPGQLIARIDPTGIAAVADIADTARAVSAAPAVATAVSTGDGAAAQELLSPSARKLVMEHGVAAEQIPATGKDGRILKEDVLRYLEQGGAAATAPAPPTVSATPAKSTPVKEPKSTEPGGARPEKRVPMTRLRARIAERLLQAQHNAAMLTTFNEVNMQPVIELRQRYRERFEKQHEVKLGFMSFFVKAVVEALKRFPEVNASIDGDDIVYHGFYDIGIAVSSPRGLVVPIVRDADLLGMAEIEKQIKGFGQKASTGTLTMEDITGGTFTITNGGVFGSMLSTPILNPPQSAILGMHKTAERPVAENGAVVIRPVMYLALSYDHRIIDGREAVQFLVTIKEALEDPARILLGI